MKIVCLGDSITYGFPFGPEASWTTMLARATGHEVINRGINGNTTRDMMERFERHVLAHRPDMLIILGGANDIVWHESFDRITWNLREMADRALEAGIKVIMGLPTPFDEPEFERRTERVREWITLFTREKNLAVIDFASAFFGEDGCLLSNLLLDGAHPTRAGYRCMFEVIPIDIFRGEGIE